MSKKLYVTYLEKSLKTIKNDLDKIKSKVDLYLHPITPDFPLSEYLKNYNKMQKEKFNLSYSLSKIIKLESAYSQLNFIIMRERGDFKF